MFRFVERAGSRLLASAATGFVAAIAMGATAVAITDSDFLYSPPKTGYYSIHPMEMTPEGNIAPPDYQPLPPGSDACFSTGVHVPQGARITQLAVWYTSPTASDPSFSFVRDNLTDGSTSSVIQSVNITDNSGVRKLAIIPLVGGFTLVSNTGFSYGFGTCPGEGGRFEGARIAYTFTNAGD